MGHILRTHKHTHSAKLVVRMAEETTKRIDGVSRVVRYPVIGVGYSSAACSGI